MYTVKQIADHLDVTTETIRYYSRLGIIEPRRDPDNGYRYYSDKDVRIINFIRKAKHFGLTINEISAIIKKSTNGESPCQLVCEMVTNHYIETREKIKELEDLESRLAQALLNWTTADDEKESESSLICPLIENE